MISVIFSKSGQPTFVALGTDALTGIVAEGPSGQRVSGGPEVQTTRPLRSRAAKFFNRGNSTYSNTFAVWRTFPTIQQAEDYLNTQTQLLPTADEMTCAITLNSGSIRFLTTPFILITDSSISGLTVRTTYNLIGGELVNENPY